MITADNLRQILRHRCEAAGGQKTWAALHQLSPQYISDVLNARREVSTKLAAKLGYSKKVFFSACNAGSDV